MPIYLTDRECKFIKTMLEYIEEGMGDELEEHKKVMLDSLLKRL